MLAYERATSRAHRDPAAKARPMTLPSTRAVGSVLLSVVLLATAPSGAALGAKKDKDKAKSQEPPAPAAAVQSIKGSKYRMAKAKMANRVTRLADADGDLVGTDGSAVEGAPGWSDVAAVYVAPVRTPAKLLTKMAKDFPPGVPRSFYGADADWAKGDRAVFVAVEMAGKLPGDSDGQQVEIGLAGVDAMPVQAGTSLDRRAGVERFSLNGAFGDGLFGTGTTDVSGREPGGDIEYYNTASKVFGYYDNRSRTWYLLMPRTQDNDALRVSVRSATADGVVIDHLEVPGGGTFVDLDDPTGGWDESAGVPLIECRSLETYTAASGVELSSPDSSLVRYTAGMEPDGDPETIAAALGPAIERMGPVDVALSAVGTDEAPLIIPAELAVAPRMNAVSLTFEAPAGQWRFELADDEALLTPAGEAIVDHVSLIGTAGLLTGPGLDGYVAGDLSCSDAGSVEDDAAPDDGAVPTADGDAGETDPASDGDAAESEA
jgi:hypothetical protein